MSRSDMPSEKGRGMADIPASCKDCAEMPLVWQVPGDPIPYREPCHKHIKEQPHDTPHPAGGARWGPLICG